jgi:hypothetical protein
MPGAGLEDVIARSPWIALEAEALPAVSTAAFYAVEAGR